MSRYSKALAALIVSLAEAGALLPTDAPRWLLAAGVAVNAMAVWAVRNTPAPAPAAAARSTAPRERPY